MSQEAPTQWLEELPGVFQGVAVDGDPAQGGLFLAGQGAVEDDLPELGYRRVLVDSDGERRFLEIEVPLRGTLRFGLLFDPERLTKNPISEVPTVAPTPRVTIAATATKRFQGGNSLIPLIMFSASNARTEGRVVAGGSFLSSAGGSSRAARVWRGSARWVASGRVDPAQVQMVVAAQNLRRSFVVLSGWCRSVENVVNEVDEVVRGVRFAGWQDTRDGDRLVQQALRRTLYIKFKIRDSDVYERALRYVREYY